MTSDSEGDLFCDTLEQMDPEQVTGRLGSAAAEALPAAGPALPALDRQRSPAPHHGTATLGAFGITRLHPSVLCGPPGAQVLSPRG